MAESWNAAVHGCGADKTVCGQAWFDTNIATLSHEDKSKITYDKSNSIYRFGDGKKIPALKNAKIPALIGSQKVMIDTDIVSNEVPLLYLRESMKKANMHLNFQDNTVSALGQTINIIVTKIEYCAVLLTLPCQMLNSVTNNSNVNIARRLENSLIKNDMAYKLHKQFARASSEKFLKLLKSADKPWSHDKKLHDEILKVSKIETYANCTGNLHLDQSLECLWPCVFKNALLWISSFTKVKSCSIKLITPQGYQC